MIHEKESWIIWYNMILYHIIFIYTYTCIYIYIYIYNKWSQVVDEKQNTQIPQNQDKRNTYVIMKTMFAPGCGNSCSWKHGKVFPIVWRGKEYGDLPLPVKGSNGKFCCRGIFMDGGNMTRSYFDHSYFLKAKRNILQMFNID